MTHDDALRAENDQLRAEVGRLTKKLGEAQKTERTRTERDCGEWLGSTAHDEFEVWCEEQRNLEIEEGEEGFTEPDEWAWYADMIEKSKYPKAPPRCSGCDAELGLGLCECRPSRDSLPVE